MSWVGPIANIRGPEGPQGLPGASGGGFTHTQSSPAATWTVVHNLGRMVNVFYVGDDGFAALVDAQHDNDLNTLYLTFSTPTTGKAVCSLWLLKL
jgi:hypothetical protein